MTMTIEQITAAYPNVAKLEEAAHEEIMCREVCDTSDKWQDEVSPEAVLALVGIVKALAAENAGLKAAKEIIRHLNVNREEANFCGIDDCHIDDAIEAMITPATDRFIADVTAKGRMEGAHFVANRMLAAWESGFIDDTAKNAADIARMILTSTEFMPDAPEGDFDRSYADEVLNAIAQQLREAK